MNNKLGIAALGSCLMLLTGCISAPFVPPLGGVYSEVNAPLSVDPNKTPVTAKKGEASSSCVLCLVSWGDVSAKTAADNGGLKTIDHMDYKYFNVLGIYQKTTVVAYGE